MCLLRMRGSWGWVDSGGGRLWVSIIVSAAIERLKFISLMYMFGGGIDGDNCRITNQMTRVAPVVLWCTTLIPFFRTETLVHLLGMGSPLKPSLRMIQDGRGTDASPHSEGIPVCSQWLLHVCVVIKAYSLHIRVWQIWSETPVPEPPWKLLRLSLWPYCFFHIPSWSWTLFQKISWMPISISKCVSWGIYMVGDYISCPRV